jgi:2-polyprenyl-3-methyl-5-hydroxy-6-metoxy-1,4-benzoquinol methylase
MQQDDIERFRVISERNFPILTDLKVLELGPFEGAFTKHILKYTNNLTVIELNRDAAQRLKNNFPTVNVIVDDFNHCLNSVGEFDAVVLYGILYHSPSPLNIIEHVVNFIKPKYILLENLLGIDSEDRIIAAYELPNGPGMRYSDYKTSNIVMSYGQNHLNFAM